MFSKVNYGNHTRFDIVLILSCIYSSFAVFNLRLNSVSICLRPNVEKNYLNSIFSLQFSLIDILFLLVGTG